MMGTWLSACGKFTFMWFELIDFASQYENKIGHNIFAVQLSTQTFSHSAILLNPPFGFNTATFVAKHLIHQGVFANIATATWKRTQFKCRSCDKIFPFESQLKSHRHMHRRNRNYICPSANCGKSFKHPSDLASHARSHRKPLNCAHCPYSNPDIWNLQSHLHVHSREAPFLQIVWQNLHT